MEASGKRYILHPSRSDVFRIWNLSDLHIGNRSAALTHIKRDIETIRNDPYSFWFGGGDYADYISPTDPRWDADTIDDTMKVRDLAKLGTTLMWRVRDTFQPIAHKCMGLLFGNHETKYMRYNTQSDLHATLCTELGVPNLRLSSFVDVVFAREPKTKKPAMQLDSPQRTHGAMIGTARHVFRFYLHHGAGGASTTAGKLTRLEQFMHSFDADVYMIGHVHGQTGERMPRIGADAHCQKLVEKTRVGVISGGYLKTYEQGVTGYGEEKAYRPSVLGAACVSIRPETREVKGEI